MFPVRTLFYFTKTNIYACTVHCLPLALYRLLLSVYNVQNVNFSMIYVYCCYIKLSDSGAGLYTAPHLKPHHKCLLLLSTLLY